MRLVEIETEALPGADPGGRCRSDRDVMGGIAVDESHGIRYELSHRLHAHARSTPGSAEATRHPLRLVDDVPREDMRIAAVALEYGRQHAIEKRGADGGVSQHVAASTELHARLDARAIAPQKIEQYEHDLDVAIGGGSERRIDIGKEVVVQAER